MTDDELAVRLDAIAYLSGAEAYVDRFEQSTAHGRRGLRVARATGQGELVPMLAPALATSLCAIGLLREAGELLDGVVEGARLSGNRQTLAWSLINRAFVASLDGEIDTATATAEESIEVTRSSTRASCRCAPRVMLAIARLESGNPRTRPRRSWPPPAASRFRSFPEAGAPSTSSCCRAATCSSAALDEAERTAGFAAAVATATGLASNTAWAERAAAAVALARGRRDRVSSARWRRPPRPRVRRRVDAAVSRP